MTKRIIWVIILAVPCVLIYLLTTKIYSQQKRKQKTDTTQKFYQIEYPASPSFWFSKESLYVHPKNVEYYATLFDTSIGYVRIVSCYIDKETLDSTWVINLPPLPEARFYRPYKRNNDH